MQVRTLREMQTVLTVFRTATRGERRDSSVVQADQAPGGRRAGCRAWPCHVHEALTSLLSRLHPGVREEPLQQSHGGQPLLLGSVPSVRQQTRRSVSLSTS